MKNAPKLLSLCLFILFFVATTFAQESSKSLAASTTIISNSIADDWKKQIWRIIDVNDKMNLPFAYPEMPFFTILMDAAINGEITAYSMENDNFTYKLLPVEVAAIGQTQFVRNDLDHNQVKHFLLKEEWFFDEKSSTMKVQILGIAPLKDVNDDNGKYSDAKPMFWVSYPQCRDLLAQNKVFNIGNDSSLNTWADLMEQRFFSSHIYKEGNVN